MRHQDIHIGSTYLVAQGLFVVLQNLGRQNGDSGEYQFRCRIVDDHQEFDPEQDYFLTSRQIERAMSREEYSMFRDRLNREYKALLRQLRQAKMPNMIRSWDDHLCAA